MKSQTIIFDIDGTAIDSPEQKIPNQRLINAVRSVEKNYYVCAATGRVWTFAKPVLQGLSLSDPCIISAGTQICNPVTGEILWQCEIEAADLNAAVGIVKQYPDYKVLYNDNDEHAYLYGGIHPDELKIIEPVYFLEQIFVPSEVAPEIVDKLTKIEGIACTLVVAQRPGFSDIHITNKNATKEHAVAELLRILSVDKEHTIGLGDGHNDVHLFRAVNTKIAMGNAVSELKQAADDVIGDVKDDGMAKYLEGLVSG